MTEGSKTFGDAPSALAWAEGVLSRTQMPISAVSKMMKTGARIVGIGREDARDLALTIVSVAHRVDPLEAGWLFVFLYGKRDDAYYRQLLMDRLMRYTFSKLERAKPGYLVRGRIIHAVLNAHRRYVNKNQHQRAGSMRSMAKELDIPWTSFRKNVEEIRFTLRQWQDTADRHITDELVDKGIIA